MKYLVRADVTYSIIVEAENEMEAIKKSPSLEPLDFRSPWSRSDPEWDAEESAD